MKEVRVYHSLWKSILPVVGCLAFACCGLLMLQNGGNRLVAWTGILFFGLGGLFIVYLILRERLTRTPYLLIGDKSITVMNGKRKWEVNLAEVDAFFLVNVSKTNMIGILYKHNVELQKIDKASTVGRFFRKVSMNVADVQEAITADNLTMKPQQLCDLLNERLKMFHKTERK